jgi:hypothetical protein
LEGDKVKREYNSMLKKQGVHKPGAYQVQERYGIWLSKDYIPIQRKNEWITTKGSEFTKFHAFVNCQALRLTANRGSIENTPAEILSDLEGVVRGFYNDIQESDEWAALDYLTQSVTAYQTEEKEKKDYARRVRLAKAGRVAQYGGATLIEPRQENGVYAIFVAMQTLKPDLFPFEVVDYDTHNGIDVLAKTRDNVDVGRASLKYVEFKHILTESFSHSFRYLHSIVCWKSQVQHEQTVEDIAGVKRKMIIVPRANGNGTYTQYMLDDPREPHKIQVFVLEDFLRERLGIIFAPRSSMTD